MEILKDLECPYCNTEICFITGAIASCNCHKVKLIYRNVETKDLNKIITDSKIVVQDLKSSGFTLDVKVEVKNKLSELFINYAPIYARYFFNQKKALLIHSNGYLDRRRANYPQYFKHIGPEVRTELWDLGKVLFKRSLKKDSRNALTTIQEFDTFFRASINYI